MVSEKTKQFRDPVHGYIAVPASYCAQLIDTPIFQRLKHIEQTSMRPVYPSARHDRFVHSLGVFHLASIAFGHLRRNTNPVIFSGMSPDVLDAYGIAFEVAGLMHDCGHSPFSHTLEAYYDRGGRAQDYLLQQVDGEFSQDYKSLCNYGSAPKAHEIFSAALFLQHYGDQFRALCDGKVMPSLVARMITGCPHWQPTDPREQLENCLIRLVNGPAIDVDKLDYILRDTWASGVNNVSIDIDRLLAALELVPGTDGLLTVAFRQSALSVIKSVLDGRNFLNRWVYAHHKVKYFDRALNQAVLSLDKQLSGDLAGGMLLDAIFSARAFQEPVCVGPCCLYLPCDDDIFSLLKMHGKDIPEVMEILSRTPRLVPLWKTQAEFELILRSKNRAQRAYIRDRVPDLLRPVLGDERFQAVVVLPVAPSVLPIEESQLFV